MEKKLLNLLTSLCFISFPFLFKGRKVGENLLIFFSKGVLSTLIDAYVVGTKRVEYPIRPFPNIFKTNIIFDVLFFPLLSVVWVKISYNDKLWKILLKSLIFSVPMSVAQWYMEKTTRLFKWKKWTPFHTFGSVNFTLFTIRGFVGLLKIVDKLKGNQKEVV
ncbi:MULTISPECIES: CBO0543 family protein [unclassified Sutcliffiella]|uniref:CBO0543 family protein n=1 Tax=unclassified Sutcliffiella TaxID=2837532 RepID=UPI0030CAEEA4